MLLVRLTKDVNSTLSSCNVAFGTELLDSSSDFVGSCDVEKRRLDIHAHVCVCVFVGADVLSSVRHLSHSLKTKSEVVEEHDMCLVFAVGSVLLQAAGHSFAYI